MTTPSQRKDELNCSASGATHSAQPYTHADQATHNGSPHGNEGDSHEESSLSSVVSGYTQAASEVLTLAELESRVAAVLFVLLKNTAKRITLRNTLAAVTGSPKV